MKSMGVKSGLLVLALWLVTAIAAAADSGANNAADILKIRNVEISFHQAGSWLPRPDLDMMMSLYADDAALTDTAHGNKLYQGKQQVRDYFAKVAAPFQPGKHWIGYTPAMRIKAAVDGDKATLYFECLWMDVDRNAIGAHSFSDITLERSGDQWLIKTIRVGKVDKL
ncbi:nuclear transport factor 2 family protein [Dyella flagellata]|nr:nuclear transport factor 2 family protein [Dyella flagellata]